MEIGIRTAKSLMKKLVKSDNTLPLMLHSSPGVGKSSIVRQVCDELGIDFIDIRLSSMEASDVQGIPYVDGSEMKFSTPEWFPTDPDATAIVFFDEISNATIDVQKAAYRIILDRQIQNGKTLPKGVKVVAAGNLKSDKTGAKDLVPALANRFGFHCDIVARLDDFRDYAIQTDLDNRVIGFLEWKPDMLHNFDPMRNEHSFPTPRSWEALSELLSVDYTEDELAYVVEGCVGKTASYDFFTYLKYHKSLPKMEDIMTGAIDYKIDNSDRGVVFALTSAITKAAIDNIEDDAKIDNLWKVVNQLEDEFIALVYRNLRSKGENFMMSLVSRHLDTWKRVAKRL